MNFWDRIELFLYVVANEYYWLIALLCMILIMLPMAVKIIKDHKEEIN